MKICKNCNQSKPPSEYYTHRKDCKACVSQQYHANKVLKGYPTYEPKQAPTERTCRVCNQLLPISQFYVSKPSPGRKSPKIETRCKPCSRQYYSNNKDRILALAASKRIPKPKPPKKTAEETQARQTAYIREKRRNNPLAKLRANIGTLIANSLARQGYKKSSKSASILSCSFDEFYTHIESQFTVGMSWDNRNLWHIDHIIPVAFASTEQELLTLNHYSNLRPMWIVDNLIKGNSIVDTAVNHPVYKTILANRISG